MTVENPQSFSLRTDCAKAAWQNGFRLESKEEEAGWRRFGSTTAKGHVWLAGAGAGGPWYLATDHPGVAAELGLAADGPAGPGIARYAFTAQAALYEALHRVYDLGLALPDGPLESFAAQTAALPKSTEAERLVVQRIGQDIFRAGLLAYWQGRCPLTGIAEPALLRASHIVPWADCASDAERLDVHNGLLLSALWDAAFDRFLVSFDDAGAPLFSPKLDPLSRTHLTWTTPLALTDAHRERLAWHRERLVT